MATNKANEPQQIVTIKGDQPAKIATNIEDSPLYKELKQFRYESSKAEGIKPYFIYNNTQMENMISTLPQNIDDLKKVPGFGDANPFFPRNDVVHNFEKFFSSCSFLEVAVFHITELHGDKGRFLNMEMDVYVGFFSLISCPAELAWINDGGHLKIRQIETSR
jgi:hypothetical protein